MRNIIIMGAAGRDFHVFNMCYRDNKDYNVVAFTATQIPNIERRKYPSILAGKNYPDGIPIYSESSLTKIIKDKNVSKVIFAYSDVSYDYVDKKRSIVKKAGASFKTFDIESTMLKSIKPVIAVCAVRTGCGKSPVSRAIAKLLKKQGNRVVVIRHPMPYGDLQKQVIQRFASIEDLKRNDCTIEEMEEYEPHINEGAIVYSGVDYKKILIRAEKEADIIIWDGGNNDLPFIKPDLHIVITDPLRANDEINYFPGKINFEMADVIIINKVNAATQKQVDIVKNNAKKANPGANIIEAESIISVSDKSAIINKNVLVVEDGPTLTHGGMRYGAGVFAAIKFSAKKIVDPRSYAVGTISEVYEKYPNIGKLIPAMGYSAKQIKDLEHTINATPANTVLIATPIDLERLITINKRYVKVSYRVEADFESILKEHNIWLRKS